MIILASTSKARRRMLDAAGVGHEALAPSLDEAQEKAKAHSLKPRNLALHLATAKARSVRSIYPSKLIIGCDQLLSCAGRAFDKPHSTADALEHLLFLQGRTHVLHTAVCCIDPNGEEHTIISEPNLTMRPLARPYLENYLEQVGPDILHSVGCYQIEGRGAQLFDAIDGDLFSIQGLPLLPLLAYLRDRDFMPS